MLYLFLILGLALLLAGANFLVDSSVAIAKKAKISEEDLFTLLHSTALKYTAGKYFRPGMVFALFDALKLDALK